MQWSSSILKKEGNSAISDNTDGTWGDYVKWNNSDSERQILNDFSPMCETSLTGLPFHCLPFILLIISFVVQKILVDIVTLVYFLFCCLLLVSCPKKSLSKPIFFYVFFYEFYSLKIKKKIKILFALASVAQWTERGLQTKGSLVRFPVKAHAWVVGQLPSRRHVRSNHTLMFLSLSFCFPSPLFKNK